MTPLSFLKSLGPLALQELLSIFNSSFLQAHCPRIWMVATVIPLLKAGKPPSEVASFRPISVTSCVVKILEHILGDRLCYIDETNNIFSRFQAGFCKGRSCEDQITGIVQAIEDDFQQRPMKRSVLTLLDFSKAYDTVWREKLLLHMLNTGILQHSSAGSDLSSTTAGDVLNSSMSLVPVNVLLKVYKRKDKQINNRKDDVLFARLRSSHHPSLKQYLQ